MICSTVPHIMPDTEDASLTKARQRALCLAARRGLPSDKRAEYSTMICRFLSAMPELQTARTILSYLAAPDEADLSAFHARARVRSVTLAFPFAEGRGVMRAMIPRGEDALAAGRYGIMCPIPERSDIAVPEALDAVLIPCVGFDHRGGRLGHGAGYYDRYLPLCPRALRILIAFDMQRVEHVIRDAHDIDIPVIVTELGIHRV